MTPNEWHDRYIARLVVKAEFTYGEAEDNFQAGMGEYDYDDDPEDAADTEMSYWTDDG